MSQGRRANSVSRGRRESVSVSGFEEENCSAALSAKTAKTEQARSMIQLAISGNFLFRHLLEEAHKSILSEVIDQFEPCVVNEGGIVIKQGSRGDYFYVCETGSYDVLVDGAKRGGEVLAHNLVIVQIGGGHLLEVGKLDAGKFAVLVDTALSMTVHLVFPRSDTFWRDRV